MIKSLFRLKPGVPARVAAYARISTEKDKQQTSLEEQIDHYTKVIISNPDWEFAGIYIDDGISGTNTKFRNGFNNMVSNAKAGLIDIILVKSISRFSRNLIDLLTTVRELRKLGVEIIFETQEMSSLDVKSDMMITMYAEFAEEESLSISQNVKWRVEKNKREGKYYIPVNQMLGYRYDENKRLYIYEEEAKVIRLIYDLYLAGEGSTSIARYLNEHKIPNRQGRIAWLQNNVISILRNEKYVGDYMFTKAYIESPITHKKIMNHGQREKVLIENGHPAIIDRDTWNKVQEKIDERAKHFKINRHADETFDPYKKFKLLTGFIKCPYCGSNYVTKINHYNGKQSNRFMVCALNKGAKSCQSENYPEDVFEKIIVELIKKLKANRTYFKNYLEEIFGAKLDEDKEKVLNKNDRKIDELKKKLESLKDKNGDYYDDIKDSIISEITALTKDKLIIQNEQLVTENAESRIRSIMVCLDNIDTSSDFKDLNYRDLFTNAVIVNKGLIYFIIGNGDMNRYPLNPKLLFQSVISYNVRLTTINTTYGIVINK